MKPRSLPALLLPLLLLASGAPTHEEKPLPIHDGVGGEFSAPSSLGRDVSLSEYRGKVVLLTFGYTSCPDMCPATLAHLRALVKKLEERADDVQVLLVSVDPQNDTPEVLREYLAQFDSRFVGITGTREKVEGITKLFLVEHHSSHGEISTEYNRVPTPVKSAPLYSHSQQIYLLDKAGRTRAYFYSGSPLEEMEQAVVAVLRESTAELPARGESKTEPGKPDCVSGGEGCPQIPAHDHGAHEGHKEESK